MSTNNNYHPKVYLSGGFRTNWQSKVIDQLGDSCIFFNPREHNLPGHSDYWAWDVHFVRDCDIVFAYMEVDNPSGFGLTFEIGLAYGLNKTIILVDEKSKLEAEFERYFKIVSYTANARFDNLDAGIEYLKKFTMNGKAIL